MFKKEVGGWGGDRCKQWGRRNRETMRISALSLQLVSCSGTDGMERNEKKGRSLNALLPNWSLSTSLSFYIVSLTPPYSLHPCLLIFIFPPCFSFLSSFDVASFSFFGSFSCVSFAFPCSLFRNFCKLLHNSLWGGKKHSSFLWQVWLTAPLARFAVCVCVCVCVCSQRGGGGCLGINWCVLEV